MTTKYVVRQCLDTFGTAVPNAAALSRVHGVGSLRQVLRCGPSRRPISWAELATLFSMVAGRRYGRGTLCTWARWEREAVLPRGYWKYRYMPPDVVRMWHCLLKLLGDMQGLTVTVRRNRDWRVTCIRTTKVIPIRPARTAQ